MVRRLLLLLVVICACWNSSVVRATYERILVKPKSMAWKKKWQILTAYPLMHPQLAKASVVIPHTRPSFEHEGMLDLSVNGTKIGYLGLSENWRSIVGFGLMPLRDTKGAKSISPDKAEKIAINFFKKFYTGNQGVLTYRHISRYPNLDFGYEFEYRYEGVVIRSVSIHVSYDGFIDEAGDGDVSRQAGQNILLKIPKSRGEAAMLAAARKYLKAQGEKEATIDEMYRGITFTPHDAQKPIELYWRGNVLRGVIGQRSYSTLTYAEKTKTFSMSKWNKVYEVEWQHRMPPFKRLDLGSSR